MHRLVVACALLLGACPNTPTTVLLRIEAGEALGAPNHLTLDLYGSAGWEVRSRRLPEGGTVTLPSEVVLYPPRESGTLRVAAHARLADGGLVGEGTGTVTLQASAQVALTLVLLPGRLADQDDDGVPDVIDNCPTIANPEQGPCDGADARVDGPHDGGVDRGDGSVPDGTHDGRSDGPRRDGPSTDVLATDGPPPLPPPSQVVTAEGWGLRLPTYPKVHYNAVWGSASSSVWIVGDAGVVLHFDGKRWQALPTGSPENLLTVWSPGPGEAWAGSSAGTVFHYAGGAWTSSGVSGGSKGLSALWGTAANDVWLLGNKNAYHYQGAGWSTYGVDFRLEANDVKGLAATAIWAVGRRTNWEGVAYYDGSTWQAATLSIAGNADDLLSVWPVSGSEVWAVGRNGTIVQYDGASWTGTKLGGPHLNGVWAAGPGQVFAVGDGGTVLRRGATGWSSQPSPTTQRLTGIWGSSSNDSWVVGENGTVLHFDGQSFSAPPTPPTAVQLEGAWWTPSNELVVVGGSGTILRRSAAGVWSADVSNTSANLYAVWGAPNSRLWSVGGGGTILHHDGTGWVSQASGSNNDLRSVWGAGPDDVWAVGGRCITDVWGVTTCNGRATHYTSVSGKWTTQSVGSKVLRGVWMDAAANAWSVGDSGTIYQLNGTQWAGVGSPTSENLNAVWSDGSSIWAVGNGGVVLERGGAGSFAKLATPATFELDAISGAGGSLFIVGRDGQALRRDGAAWSTMRVCAAREHLRGVLALGPQDVWAVGQGGVVLHFDDR